MLALMLICVQAMLSMGNSSEEEQDVHMAPVTCYPPVGSPCSTHTPESIVMSGDEAPRMSLPATPVPSSSHAQVCTLMEACTRYALRHTLMMSGMLHIYTPSTAFSAWSHVASRAEAVKRQAGLSKNC